MLYSLFTLSFFVAHSLSFSLAGPDTAQSGVPIEFTWTLDDGEPLSFGLMQRSLAGDTPILGIDDVTNSAGARTGTASVIFWTAGQIILSGVDQLSYNPAIQPSQFSAGKQLTITENTSPGGMVQPSPPPPPPHPTTAPGVSTTTPISKIGPSTTATSSMTTPLPTAIVTAADSASTLSSDGNPESSIFLSTTFGLQNSKPKQSTTIPSLPDFTDSAVTTLSGEATFISALTTPPARPPISTTAPSSQHATKSGPNIHTIIAAVVTLVIVLIIGGLALFLRQQRSSTASRLRRFRLRINHLTSPEAVDGMSIVSRTSAPLCGPTRDISAGSLVRFSTDSALSARPGDRLSLPVVSDKQPFSGNDGDVTMQAGNGTGPAVNGRIPLTPPPSYDGHSFVKFD
ncbi:hypothetical protein FB451DRAFT_1380461 [Mycena latifolia]|nr:hypothetical protein FB451DRAFT_1380461 [Mycena latifolia]